MAGFYKNAGLMFSGLIAFTSVLAFICYDRTFASVVLLPAQHSGMRWELVTITDVEKGGSSSIEVNDVDLTLDYHYTLTGDVQYPHVTAVIAFSELENAEHLVDLSEYSTASFRVRCAPGNVLAFHLHSLDRKVTDPKNFSSYRISETLFSCDHQWSDVEIDLRHMKVPEWWLSTYDVPVSDQKYSLDNVIAFSIGASRLGPLNTPANVNISGLALHTRDWGYAWAFAGFFIVVWGGFLIWLFREYTRTLIADLKNRLRRDQPLLAHRQLSIESNKDEEALRLLRFIATQYADPDLNLEKAIAVLGINRNKINEMLKKELGFTFATYLNKLRLTEAARLLSEEDRASIAEIAYSVGYNNVSYFNKLFKKEYGYTPKAFKHICQSDRARNRLKPRQ